MRRSGWLLFILAMASFGCGDSSSPAPITPSPPSPPPPTTLPADPPSQGWQPYVVKQGDGQNGWIEIAAEYQLMTIGNGQIWFCPYGVAQFDNGEIFMLGDAYHGTAKEEFPAITFSSDGGQTWASWKRAKEGVWGRPLMLTYLGGGDLFFSTDMNYFSHDYGRTWPETAAIPPAAGRWSGMEGNRHVDRDVNGQPTRVGEIVWNMEVSSQYPLDPSIGFIRWSEDGGKTWGNEVQPGAWFFSEDYNGRTYRRGVSEGSLVRAANGWLVAALRTDMPARFISIGDDGLEGLGVSVSKDNGQTWSQVQVIYEAGRHHGHLLLMPNGDIVLTYILRHDILNGETYEATPIGGCEALVSHDHGETWDVSRKYVLQHFEFSDGSTYPLRCGHLFSCLLDDGSILTAYGDYPRKGAGVIKWRPN